MAVDSRTNERGQGRIGLLISVALVGIAIFTGVKFIPVKVAAYQFKDVLTQECRMAAVRRNDAAVAQRILDKAEELDVPLQGKNLKVRRTRSEMIIRASYEQPIDLKVTTYVFKFDHEEKAPLF
jgi:hypothetical protein